MNYLQISDQNDRLFVTNTTKLIVTYSLWLQFLFHNFWLQIVFHKKNLKIWKKKLLLICPQYAATPWSPLCCYFLAIDEYLKFVHNDKLSNTLIFVRKAYQTCESH